VKVPVPEAHNKTTASLTQWLEYYKLDHTHAVLQQYSQA
jgi:hypothetical protein